METGTDGTSGDAAVTSGGRLGRVIAAVVPVAVIVQVTINAVSRVADGRAAGRPVAAGAAWGYELTSGLAILLLLPMLWWLSGSLMPSRVGWPRAIAGHVAGSLGFSAAHVGIMVGLRLLLWHGRYDAGPVGEFLLYEYRKDGWSYIVIVMMFALSRTVASARGNAATISTSRAEPADGQILVVQDGTRRHHVPIRDIHYARAAGNYVEVAVGSERLLHRATLTAMEEQLGEGFVRIHRGVVVARRAIATVETTPAGDFAVTTIGGDVLKGSRRYRSLVAL
jgi:hypothetical protein